MWFFSVLVSADGVGRERRQQDGHKRRHWRRTSGRQRVQQQRKQRPERQAQVYSGHPAGGRAGGPVCRVPPARFRVRRRLQFQNPPDMRLPESNRYQVSTIWKYD